MIKLPALLLALLLLASFAPAPASHTVYWTRIGVSRGARVQACTYDTAPATARLSAPIFDSIGYPYGQVSAWSCAGDALAVARELAERAATMQAEAEAYRAAHPIAGLSQH